MIERNVFIRQCPLVLREGSLYTSSDWRPKGIQCSCLMFCRLTSSLVVLLLAAVCGSSQIIFPGQYPNGQGRYPGGIGFPGGGGRRTRTQAPVQTLDGTLRKISSSELTLESDDKLVTTVALSSSTRYYHNSSDSYSSNGNAPPSTAKRTDFQPGDQVSIDATQDENNYYRAAKVILVKAGPGDDHSSTSSGAGSGGTNDDDRPRLHRPGQPDTAATTQPQPASRPANNNSDDDQPTLRRGASSSRSTSSADADPPVPVASARPSIHADEVNGVTRLPDAPAIDPDGASSGVNPRRLDRDTDPVIDSAREAAFSFAQTLPNYVVKQFTTRYATEAARGGKTSWVALDTVTADVVSENGAESYKNILVNGKPPKDAIEKTGSWSSGEFSSLLLSVLSPNTDAAFRNKRSTTIVNRAAFRYDFSVEQVNSNWHVHAASESYVPAFNGAIWIDKENYRVLRIELAAQKMPKTFSLDTVESAVDYDYVLIGAGKFLLPTHSEALSCVRGTGECTRNVIDFRNYKKFSADTSITFEPEK
jgi:hypothetical protein